MSPNNPIIYSSAALRNQFQYDNVAAGITSRQKSWMRSLMIPKIFSGASVAFESKDSEFKRIFRPRQNAKAVVSTVSPSSGTSNTLTITWQDPSFDGYRKHDIIRDDVTQVEAKVIEHYAGGVIVESQPGKQLFDAGVDFQAGAMTKFNYTRMRTYNSGGVENRFGENSEQLDYSDITDETIQLSRNEKITATLGLDKAIYVWSQEIQDITDDFERQLGYKYWFSKGGTMIGSDGRITATMGIRERIIQSGKYYPGTSAPTLDVLVTMASYMASKNGTSFQDFLFVMGRKALVSIQQDATLRGLVTYSGINNTVGGKNVSGLDVMYFQIGMMRMNFTLGTFLDDTEFRAASDGWSIYGLDLTEIPTLGANGQGQSPIMRIHRGSAAELIYSYIPGKEGMRTINQVAGNSFRATSTNVDGETYNVMGDCGISILAENWTLFEWPTGY